MSLTRSERRHCDAKIKRLERGTFALPQVEEETVSVILSTTELAMLLGGIDLKRARQRNRYQIPA